MKDKNQKILKWIIFIALLIFIALGIMYGCTASKINYKVVQDLGQYDQKQLGWYGFKKEPYIGQDIPVGDKKNKLEIKRIDKQNKTVYVK